MDLQQLINNKEFMNEFIQVANDSFEYGGGYDDVYETYEDRFTDSEILSLLDYCEANNLLND